MVWKVAVQPESEPVTLSEVKAHLRVDGDDDNVSIIGLIEAARQYIELTCNRALMPQTWVVSLPSFGCGEIPMPGGNVRAIDSITYFDTDNAQQTLAAADYFSLLTEPAKIAPKLTWPSTYRRPDAVSITLSVGYEAAAKVPSPIKSAHLLQVELLFDRPAGPAATALENARDALLSPYIDGRLLV